MAMTAGSTRTPAPSAALRWLGGATFTLDEAGEPTPARAAFGWSLLLSATFGLLACTNAFGRADAPGLLRTFCVNGFAAWLGLMPALLFVLVLERRWRHLAGARRVARLAAAVAGAVLATSVIEPAFWWMLEPKKWHAGWAYLSAVAPNGMCVALVTGLLEAEHRRRSTRSALHAARLREVELQGQVAEAQAAMLQAQIEPHFLFNSLANVRRLARVDRAGGAAMLGDLLSYFRATLPRLRSDEATLAHELESTRAFLAVHKVRMGERLQVEFAIAEGIERTRVPPMAVLTLVENALKHGIGPLARGGRIVVRAERRGDDVHVSVVDDGRGLVPGKGTGTGLANLRGRLRATCGDRASIGLFMNEPRGTLARLVVPARADTSAAAVPASEAA